MSILARHCIGCHGEKRQRGELRLSTRDSALAGGERGPAIVPGDPTNSRLLRLIGPDGDPHMPPKGQLKAAEIEALTLWIQSGAPWNPEILKSPRIDFISETKPPPPSWRPVMAMSISPDDRWLAFGRGPELRIHDLRDPAFPLHAVSRANPVCVQSIAWTADGRRLFAGGFQSVIVWDTVARMAIQEWTEFRGTATAMAVSSDDRTLVVASGFSGQPATLALRSIPPNSGGQDRSWIAHDDSVYSVTFFDHDRFLISAGGDGFIKVWDAANGLELERLEGHSSHVLALAVSPDRTLLASAGADRDVKVWNTETWEVVQTIRDYPGNVTGISWVSGSEPRLLSICEDGIPRRCRTDGKRPERGFSGAPDVLHAAAVAGDSLALFAGCNDGRVYVWDKKGTLLGSLDPTGLVKP